MKYLFNAQMEAKMKGEFVEANEDAGQFIFDSEVVGTGAVIEGIAKANSIKINARDKVSDKHVALIEGLALLPLSEVAGMTDSMKVKEIVEAGVEEGKSDNDMLVEIVNSGVSFKAAIKMFKAAMEDGGFRITAKKRAEKITELLDELDFSPETYDDVEVAVNQAIADVEDTSASQAASAIRKYAKANDIELPKAPKKSSGGGFRVKMFAWMVANPESTEDEFKGFIEESGKKEAVAKRFWPMFEVAKGMAATLNA